MLADILKNSELSPFLLVVVVFIYFISLLEWEEKSEKF